MGQVIKIEIPVEVTDKTEPALSSVTSKLKAMDAAAKSTARTMEQSGKSSGFEKAYQRAKKWASGKYQAAMEIKDMASPVISKVTGSIKGFTGKIWRTTVKVADLATAPIRKIGSLLKSPLMAAGVSLSAGAAVGSAVNTYAGFESQMSQVKAISGASQEEFLQLTEKAKEMGATTKFTAQESAEAFHYMAMAGWKTSDMMGGIGGILNLAAASGENLGTTSDIVTDALTAFQLKASDAGHFSDVLAQASANANTNVGMMGESFKYVAPVAGALGYSIEDTSLALGLMANASVKGSMAGTALKTSLANLASPTDNMAAAMKKYGVSLTDSQGNMKSLRGVMENLRTSLGGLSETEQTAAASTIFGKEAMAGMLAIINASESDWNKLASAVDHADGASQKMANTMLDNLSGKFTLFQSALDGVKISLGERIQPYLMEALDWMTNKMPDVEDMLIRGMDRIDEFVDNTKEKIADFTTSPEWENADLFGKMHIAWDELIGKPFSEWWSGGGSEMIVGKAAQIGEGIGAGISGGLLALLGFDIHTGINEGASIGESFAHGFISGFDTGAVKEAITGAMGGMFQNAGKIFTGNADITSWLSAAAIAKTATPILSMLGKGVSFGGHLIGGVGKSARGGLLKKAIGSFSAADELAGVGTVAGTGLKGLLGKTGMVLGSGAATAEGLVTAGAASVAGGLMGAGALFSAGKNIYRAVNAKDNEEQSANIASAGLKVTGVGAGAGLGAAIGSAFFGIGAVPGALIGAGIGGLMGMFTGGKVEENYEKKVEEKAKAEEEEALMTAKSKYALKGSRFESEELSKAMKDTTVSAEQFGQMMQEAASQKIQDSFGNIKLSMQEIKDAARQIIFEGDDKGLTQYASAAADAESSMSSLQSAASSMEKLNWKAGMGMIDDAQSAAQYQSGIDNMISSAGQYVEDQHYQATAALGLLIKPGSPVDFTTGLNTMYSDYQSQINTAGEELQRATESALADGKISSTDKIKVNIGGVAYEMDEQSALTGLQQQITDITGQISSAQSEAGMQALKIKYSGAQLDVGSFASLTSELQSQVQESMSQYDSALEVSLTNLNMQLASGAISQEQFDAQFQAITEGYQAHIQELSVNVESFQLESIADAFGSELDGILPNLEGSVAERLGQAMHNAMAAGVDVENWDVDTASKWLDLEGLSGETQSAITEMMSQVAATMPDALVEAMNQTGGEGGGNFMSQMIGNMDASGFGNTVLEKMGEGLASADMSEAGSNLSEGLQTTLLASMENIDLSETATALSGKLGEAMAGIEMDESGAGLQEGLASSISASFEGMDFSAVTSAVGSGVSSAIEASMGTIQGAISNLYSQVGSSINSAFAAGFQTTTTVTITVNYQLANPTATISFSGGGTGTATVSASVHANGGFVNGPELSWIGEDGPEAVIPLGGKRRARGIELWNQVGSMLGIPQHANGGIFGSSAGTVSYSDDEGEDGDSAEKKVNLSVAESGKNNFQVSVNLNPTFEITNDNPASIMQMIKAQLNAMMDDIGDEIAERLMDNFSNMPV